jgi:hypothetical protein
MEGDKMLLSKLVSVNITPRNRKIYLNKGYSDSVVGNSIQVKFDDLPQSSGQLLNVKCDYCPKEYQIRYCDYVRTKHEFLDKDACENCWHKKRQDIFQYKLENNLLNDKEKRGYWSNPDNVKKELRNYIETNGHTGKNGDNKEESAKWDMIHWGIKKHRLDLNELVSELGFNLSDLQQKNPNGYVIPLEELKEKIDTFVKVNGFFPDQRLLSKELKIHSSDYQKHGTLSELREKFGYNNKMYLVDKRGFINKSLGELIVANYLIVQNIPYKREQYPFRQFDSKLNYRSDFTFYLPSKEIHLEVWGGMNVFNGQRELFDYDEVMQEKIKLYDKYRIELISVTPDIFYNSIGTIKKKLYSILSPYLNLPFIEVKDRLVSTFTLHEMSDEELLNEIMQFSTNNKILPSHGLLREKRHEFLYKEVLKRFDSLKDFANKHNLITAYDARSKVVMQSLTPTK